MHSDPSPHSKPARPWSPTRTNSIVTHRPKRECSAEDRSRRSSASGDSAAIPLPFLQGTPSLSCITDPKHTPLVSASITDLVAEPLFYHSYLSEEEPLSTSDSDSMTSASLDSTCEASLDLDNLETNFPELLAESCTFVEQQCGKAQAVVLKVVGRPKVIDVPSSPTGAKPTLKRAATSPIHGPVSRLSRISSHSRKSSASESSNASPPPETYHPSGSAPSTPILDHEAQTPTSEFSPITPRTPRNPDFSYFNARKGQEDVDSTPKAVKKTSRFRLTSLYKRTASSETVPTLQPTTQPMTAPRAPPTSPAVYRPKMIARGANERSPTLELPPFPESDEDDPRNGKAGRPLVKRQDSMASIAPKTVLAKKQPRIRRVESGLLR